MDASQYKDYVLVLLFIKYVSDKYAGVPYAPIVIPEGASFEDMVKLKGKPTIGDDINKKIIQGITDANTSLAGTIDVADFNDSNKLGSGKDMVNKLTNLIAIFENPDLDFSKNRAEGDDILGDAYEYLMRHFATESGKSKGQFYTPAEVSRIMAKVIGINKDNSSSSITVYDPTCGSGSLLLKVADESKKMVTPYGQEMDVATAALARMNMILHNSSIATIKRENTLANPLHLDDENKLKTFDYVVANPPFSFKSWSNGVDPLNDPYQRFKDYGIPPSKNGDYAFLLHIIRSLNKKGKGACILPHGVLFRGNAEAEIRKNLIKKKYIKGIIGLPPNLFYGTGIPACIIVIDKENTEDRKGIFMIDAGKGFMKDGNKNRLRSQDIHKIVDMFNKGIELEKYSRLVSYEEIEKNEYNLNIPRYIDTQEPEDIQDIEAHLKGGIPDRDIDELQNFWSVYPNLKSALFEESERKGYSNLKITKDVIRQAIFSNPDFTKYSKKMELTFDKWKNGSVELLNILAIGAKPKEIIHEISENILKEFSNTNLIDKYDIYQHLMEYWAETMQDDMYMIATGSWVAELSLVKDKKNELECDLVPKYLVINRFYADERSVIEDLQSKLESTEQEIQELVEEHSGEEGYFSDFEKINKGTVSSRIKEIKGNPDDEEELMVMEKFLSLTEKESETKKEIKEAEKELEIKVVSKYDVLTESEIKVLVIDDKWMASLEKAIKGEMDRISQRLTQRIKELADRYSDTLSEIESEIDILSKKVDGHLNSMGFN
jgi:type I restriction enzyme M protein